MALYFENTRLHILVLLQIPEKINMYTYFEILPFIFLTHILNFLPTDSQTYFLGKNTILVPTFWGHNQFGPYILVAINLIPIIFNLQSNWSLPLTY